MGWLEGINRRSARPKPLTSLPGADRACWKIFFEICWEAEIDDQIRRKIRARKNRKSLKNKTSPNCHRTFVWCPRVLWRPKTRPNGSLRLSPWPLARLPVGCLAPADLAGILILGLEGYPFWKLSGISTFCARLTSELSRGILFIFFLK